MAKNVPESAPSLAMPAKKRAPNRKGLAIAFALLGGLVLFLVADRDSFLHGLLFSTMPFSWDNVLVSFKDYGYLLFSLYITVTAAVLFLENRNPDRTLAWLLVLALLPVVGAVLYWFVGPNFRYLADKRRFRLPKFHGALDDAPVTQGIPLVADTVQLVYRSSGAKLLTSGGVTVFYDGATAFARIKDRLRNARRSILLESYIIENDALGNEIKDILIDRARNGVFVCVIYDAVGSWHMGKRFLAALREGGVHVRAFLPVAFPMFRGANYRNHRKILVIDGETAFMGGLNIGDNYVGASPRFQYWRDTHMELGGQAVTALRTIFLNDLALCGAPPEQLARAGAAAASPEDGAPSGWNGTRAPELVPLQIVASGPDTPWDTIQKGYFSLIARARKRLWLTTPYLVPGGTLMDALCTASLSGVDVRILLPGKADHALVYWASASCCDELLRAGVRIFLYDPARFVHAKTMVADGALLSIGSANLDTRSLQINFEVQAFIYDARLAGEMEAAFTKDAARSLELVFATWRKRPKIQKVKESAGRLFSSLL